MVLGLPGGWRTARAARYRPRAIPKVWPWLSISHPSIDYPGEHGADEGAHTDKNDANLKVVEDQGEDAWPRTDDEDGQPLAVILGRVPGQ